MPSVKDVPADQLISELARYIKENVPQVKPPVWAPFVKTGANKERPPMSADWWYVRAASLMRKLYIHGPVGVGSLRTAYGYRAKIGDKTRPERARKAGGAVIRKILQQLEQAGLVAKTKKGRVLTPEGRSLVDRLVTKIAKDLVKARPELAKYVAPPRE
ncbi:MAG: 30S ribosomal protein S19e [Pyrobaculum sp.]|jgi:small subunit ribosomal protein S19e|uniref:30S ribosomal protein S19e n=1 Tax=Pyrobaculum sp. 3827-6 TaxID=2983604 RepID=UPI0021D8822D|nr:30S ribosomal protein S19e [Pyrobaculum sp. 3827-6]MCU7787352.1 30S ribosomal protein S19e [Pyrobaculum sp. 3827-6]